MKERPEPGKQATSMEVLRRGFPGFSSTMYSRSSTHSAALQPPPRPRCFIPFPDPSRRDHRAGQWFPNPRSGSTKNHAAIRDGRKICLPGFSGHGVNRSIGHKPTGWASPSRHAAAITFPARNAQLNLGSPGMRNSASGKAFPAFLTQKLNPMDLSPPSSRATLTAALAPSGRMDMRAAIAAASLQPRGHSCEKNPR